MKVYISGISGTGMGPLALMAKNAGFTVVGSDLHPGAIYDELVRAGIEVHLGPQDGSFLSKHLPDTDWFVRSSAITDEHPELKLAHQWRLTTNPNLKITKRDDFTAFLVEKLGLKMIAVAGTHGKTTTTSMIIWACLKLGLPVSYVVGTTLMFAQSGAYHLNDRYFIYEADEYDRNFLKFYPWLSVITTISYDHPDIYPTREDYSAAFLEFKGQSTSTIEWSNGGVELRNLSVPRVMRNDFRLAGEARRIDAVLATMAVEWIAMNTGAPLRTSEIVAVVNEFPGVGRRFERISDGVYTDYAHHPEEIVATLSIAKEQASIEGLKGVVVVYQPHQNTRQHEVRAGYADAFINAQKIFWLPTYLTRENPSLPILTPTDFINSLTNANLAEAADLSNDLAKKLKDYAAQDCLILLMTAGPADAWFRDIWNTKTT